MGNFFSKLCGRVPGTTLKLPEDEHKFHPGVPSAKVVPSSSAPAITATPLSNENRHTYDNSSRVLHLGSQHSLNPARMQPEVSLNSPIRGSREESNNQVLGQYPALQKAQDTQDTQPGASLPEASLDHLPWFRMKELPPIPIEDIPERDDGPLVTPNLVAQTSSNGVDVQSMTSPDSQSSGHGHAGEVTILILPDEELPAIPAQGIHFISDYPPITSSIGSQQLHNVTGPHSSGSLDSESSTTASSTIAVDMLPSNFGQQTPHTNETSPAVPTPATSSPEMSGTDDRQSAAYSTGDLLPHGTIHKSENQFPVVLSSQVHTAGNSVRSRTSDDRVSSPSSAATGGFFPNASNFSVHNPVMQEIHEHHGPNVLEKMRKSIIRGAEFNSSERDNPPRCHEGTRTSFIEQLQTRIRDTTLRTRIIWLVGPAGVGKSAIMQSLAETVYPLDTLRCATLFFSRPDRRDDPKRVFTTLAYGFAVGDPEYRHYMEEKLADDPGFLDKSLEEQFKRFFATPFTTGRVNPNPRHWVVFLDGFDEINGEVDQRRVLDLIRGSFLSPTEMTPLIWLISSRCEAHLQVSFRQLEQQIGSFWKFVVPINSEEALRSVALYLDIEFAKIRDNYPDIVLPSWPLKNDLAELTAASLGLFLFASTVVNYVGKENPVRRLERVLSRIRGVAIDYHISPHEAEENPFQALDALYTLIISDVPVSFLPTAKNILGFYLLGDAVTSDLLPLLHLCNILGLKQDEAYAALRKLHSVLKIPSLDKAYKEPLRFLHVSFSDFLKDRSLSRSYYIDLDKELLKIWWCYDRILKSAPVGEPSGYIALSWVPSAAEEQEEVRDRIRSQAHTFWFMILTRFCHDPSCQCTKIRHLSLDTAEVVEVFEKSGVGLYECLWSKPPNDDIADLCDSLLNHAPVTLRQRVVFKSCVVLDLTESDVDSMFRGLQLNKPAFYHIDDSSGEARWVTERFSLENLDVDQWAQEKQLVLGNGEGTPQVDRPYNWKMLASLLIPRSRSDEEAGTVKVIIVRTRPKELYAIIGPFHTKISEGIHLEYLGFPYVGNGGLE